MPGDSWKLSLPCKRDAAEALALSLYEAFDPDEPPVIVTSEPDPARPDDWQLDIYLPSSPDDAIFATLARLAPGMAEVEHLPADDWVSLSQSGLDPVHAGRFFVHTAAHADRIPEGAVPIAIEAGRAFGTGRHETTTGCLLAIDTLAIEPENIIDLGTGSGLLAIAAAIRWPEARVIASDIDPVAIEVAAENLAANGSPPIGLVVAPGLEDAELAARAPYDLVIANILAQPLIELAASIADATKPGGTIVLAGLLETQEAAVLAAYKPLGCRLVARHLVGEWPTLVLETRRATRGTAARSQG